LTADALRRRFVGMKNTPRFQAVIKAKADNGKHQCEAGYCIERACVDFGRHIRVAGIPGEVRALCCKHAGGGHTQYHRVAQ
jgi:hypothetical protein